MTNKELQEELKKYPDDLKIWAGDQVGYVYDVIGVAKKEVQEEFNISVALIIKFILTKGCNL